VADWDADSPGLRHNLVRVLRDVRDRVARRDVLTVEDARRWHGDTMAGLQVPDKKYVGRFRGESGLETTRVWVDGHEGAPPDRVASELAAFEQTLQRAVAALDARYPRAEALDTDHRPLRMGACRVGAYPSVRERKRPDGAHLG
jgi:hypothetical protein